MIVKIETIRKTNEYSVQGGQIKVNICVFKWTFASAL